MVKGFKITSKDNVTIKRIKLALSKLPYEMEYKIMNNNNFEVHITPKTDKVKLNMYKDKLDGVRGEAIKKQYLNVIIPFFRNYVRDLKKMEVIVYD